MFNLELMLLVALLNTVIWGLILAVPGAVLLWAWENHFE